MKGLLAAWIAGESLIIWRAVHADHKPPVPGGLIGVTGLFAAMGLVADVVPSSATFLTVVAWGLDVAALLRLFPQGLGAQVSKAAAASGTEIGSASAPAAAGGGGKKGKG